MLWHSTQKNKTMEQAIDTNLLGEEIVKKLKTIYDPEIPVDIYELGLIYDVMVNEDYEVKILMTLTSPNCPVAVITPALLQFIFLTKIALPAKGLVD